MENYLKSVAIIGAGLGGCALALALGDQNIPLSIYESRAETSAVIASGVILTPNGLRVLDHLGVFSRIQAKCYVPEYRIFKNAADETTKKVPAGDPLRYGYRNHRLWRKTLLDEMRLMLAERGISISFSSKFNGIISDNTSSEEEGEVTFLINSTPHHATLLLAADGIHSSVRTHIAPGVRPAYTGLLGIIAHINRSAIAWPYASYESNATIQDKPGAIFWIAEDAAGEELMIARQVAYPQQQQQQQSTPDLDLDIDLDELQRDPTRLLEFLTRDYDDFESETAKKIIDEVRRNPETLYGWPMMRIPVLKRWFSASGRVVLVGDGAHALPPSSGQGVNQALEDVYSLTLLVGSLREKEKKMERDVAGKVWLDALAYWQKLRQERLDWVVDWTNNGSNVSRLPEAERKRLIEEGKVNDQQYDDMSWLFKPGTYDQIKTWVEENA